MLVKVELLRAIEVPMTVAVSERDEGPGAERVQVVQSMDLGLMPKAFPAAGIWAVTLFQSTVLKREVG